MSSCTVPCVAVLLAVGGTVHVIDALGEHLEGWKGECYAVMSLHELQS